MYQIIFTPAIVIGIAIGITGMYIGIADKHIGLFLGGLTFFCVGVITCMLVFTMHTIL